jgi:hypothetical protein
VNAVDDARSALIIASSAYQDPGLRRLRAPGSDAQALGEVLRDPQIGGFDVRTLLDQPAHEVNLAVEEFFADRRPNDLLLVHFSCHGIKDEDGELYFAAANTRLGRLGATAVAAEFVNRRMSRSRSRRVVLLLDCCYAGAFERGLTARAGTHVAIEEQLGGRGRAVITASSAMEYAFEGDELSDTREQAPSVFTSALVQGLRTGDADRDQDGHVGLDELYEYIYDKVRAATPNQTPGKWIFGVQGELYIARRSRPVSTPAPLRPELRQAIDNPLAGVRAGAVTELERLLRGRHAGLRLAATLALERLAEDDSRTVAAAAAAALAAQARPVPPERVTREPLAPEPVPTEPARSKPTPSEPVPTEHAASTPTPPEAVTSERVPPGGERASVEPVSQPATRTTAFYTRDERGLLAAGGLAIVGAVLELLAIFPRYVGDFHPTTMPVAMWFTIAGEILVFGASACVFLPRTRPFIGPGLLLGAVATAPDTPVYAVTFLLVRKYGSPGPGLWLDLAGGTILILAACIAGATLVRTGTVRFALRRPEGMSAWLVALLGVAGAIALFLQAQGEQLVPGRAKAFMPSEDLVPLIWGSAMALVMPVAAAVAIPRRFGVALLAGWIGCGVAVVSFSTGVRGSLFGYTLLALAAVIIPFARAARPRTSSSAHQAD